MTCVVGLVHDGKVYMGADSCGSDGASYRCVDKMPKLFWLGKNPTMLIGFTTSWRMGQILQYHVDVPGPRAGKKVAPPDEYVVRYFVPAAREALREHGFAEIENNKERGGNFLIAIEGHLFEVQNSFAVLESANGFAAVGDGTGYALGAMQALDGIDPVVRVERALAAAAHFSPNVMEPFRIEILECRSVQNEHC